MVQKLLTIPLGHVTDDLSEFIINCWKVVSILEIQWEGKVSFWIVIEDGNIPGKILALPKNHPGSAKHKVDKASREGWRVYHTFEYGNAVLAFCEKVSETTNTT